MDAPLPSEFVSETRPLMLAAARVCIVQESRLADDLAAVAAPQGQQAQGVDRALDGDLGVELGEEGGVHWRGRWCHGWRHRLSAGDSPLSIETQGRYVMLAASLASGAPIEPESATSESYGMDRLGRLRTFAYVDVEKAEQYRAVIGAFAVAKERFALHLRPEEVVEALPPLDALLKALGLALELNLRHALIAGLQGADAGDHGPHPLEMFVGFGTEDGCKEARQCCHDRDLPRLPEAPMWCVQGVDSTPSGGGLGR